MGSAKKKLAGMCVVATLVVLSAAAFAQQGEGSTAPFSREERRRLIAGELVRRPGQWREQSGSYVGGTSFQRVRAPREAIWEAITKTGNYPHLIPGLDRARTISDRGERRVLYLRHTYSFVSVAYHADVRIDRARWTIRFDLDRTRPHDVRDGRGFITVDRYRGRESIVTWGVMADVGGGILTGVFAPVIHDWILRVPWCVRSFVELRRHAC